MNQKINLKILLISICFVWGCNNSTTITKKEYYASGKLKVTYQLINNKKSGPAIYYYENGNIWSIEYYVNDTINGEVFDFYSNGYLERKSVTKMGVSNGGSYAFYPNGFIKEYRNWINGKKQGFGADYWGYASSPKVIYYSRNDTLTFKSEIDSFGVVTKTKGKPPLSND